MNSYVMARRSNPGSDSGRILSAGGVQLDEARSELRVNGQRRAIEAKPLVLLHALLTSADAIVSKRALMAAVWGSADHISEASLTTAMSKLRTALGAERGLIEVVHGQGYRLSLPVDIHVDQQPPHAIMGLKPAQAVPGRPEWYLQRPLGTSGLNNVWLARSETTAGDRVFKFADTDDQLAELEREVATAQQLDAATGGCDEVVPIIDWNFDERPYFIERAYGGLSLAVWAGKTERLAALGVQRRIAMVAQLAGVLAAAHAAGVLHGDIRPETILVDDSVPGVTQLRLVSFPAGAVDGLSLALDNTEGSAPRHARLTSGAPHTMAPEILRGGILTTAADIYSMGILLYQMVIADLDKQLVAGWEADVEDVLLRQDIAAAAAGDRARRLSSAARFAELLETLPQRRQALGLQAQEQADRTRLLRQIERDRARQPWIIGAVMSALAGIVISTVFAIRAMQERKLSDHQAALVQAVNTFLTDDMVGRGNPAQSGKADETLMQAATAAEANIDRRLGSDPLTAGAIYLSLADAFTGRTAFPAAADAYQRAISAFHQAGARGTAAAAIAQLREAAMLVTSAQPESMAHASALIAAAAPQIAKLGSHGGEATVWLHNASAMQQMLGGDVHLAQVEFGKAADGADALPHIFNEATRLTFRRREAFAYLRLGDWSVARDMMSSLLGRERAVNGTSHPETLQLELNLAQVQLVLGDAAAALSILNRIYPDFITVYGPEHRLTVGLLGERANAFEDLGRYNDAFSDQMHAYHIAAHTDGAHSYVALGSLTDAAQSRCRSGQLALGLNLARSAYADAQSSLGADSLLAQAAGGNLALCLIAAGQFSQASPLLNRIDTRLVTQMSLDPTYGAQVDLMRAAIYFAEGNQAAGHSLLTKALPTFAHPNEDPYMRQWSIDLLKKYPPGVRTH
jgi:DNA-binding winged helix-turn-helix (wHTH) protein